MEQSKKPEEDLAEEFRNLGRNLAETLRAAWESPERKHLQQEIETGLSELESTFKQELDTFSQSPTGQRIKADVEDVRQRIRTGEAQDVARDELLNAMRRVNSELRRASDYFAARQGEAQAPKEDKPGEPTDTGATHHD